MGSVPKVVIVTLAIAVALVCVWFILIWHEGRMKEGFDQVRSEYKKVEFVKSMKQAESFEGGSVMSLAPPASLQQQRKTASYVSNGITTFFAIHEKSVVDDALNNYLVFFQPTQADLMCDFTNISTPTSCMNPLDHISANDHAISIPSSISSTPPYAIGAANASLDTRMFVLGSMYNLLRVSINAHCLAVPITIPNKVNHAPQMLLTVPRKDYTTKLIMLLRPTYIRAMASGSPASMLYWVDWNSSANDDDTIYESQYQAHPNAVLRLVQVTGFDNDGGIDPITTPPLPALDVAINGGRKIPPATTISAANDPHFMPIPTGSTSALVLYYPKYSMPTPLGNVDAQKTEHVATVYASVVTGSYASLADSNGNIVISVKCPKGSQSKVVVSVGETNYQMPMPTGSPAYVVACASYNLVTLAVMTPSGASILGKQLVKPLSYYPGTIKGGNYSHGGGAKAVTVGVYNSTSIPNYADIALSLGCLPLPPSVPSSGTAVETFYSNAAGSGSSSSSTPQLILRQGQSMKPGQSIVSEGGAYTAIYQLDGQLVVYATSPDTLVWASGLTDNQAGTCTLGTDGVLRLFAGGVNKTQAMTPYWTSMDSGSNKASGSSSSSSRNIPGADQAPFGLVVVDNPPGQLQIVGKFSATPVWTSSE